jgi:hypothetical protein
MITRRFPRTGLNSRSGTSRERAQETQRGKAAAEVKTVLTQRRREGRKKRLFSSAFLRALCVSALILLSPIPHLSRQMAHVPSMLAEDQCNPKRRLPPELVVRRPDVSPPPPANLPSKRWRDLTYPGVALAKADPPRLACCPTALSSSLGGDTSIHHSSFIISATPGLHRNRAAARALPGRSAAAARLRSWRWGKTARKPAKLVC